MKRNRLIIIGMIGLVLVVGLSGCNMITSASPDTGTVIRKSPGEKIILKVTGPDNTATKRCIWTIERNRVGGLYNEEVLCEERNDCEYVINPDTELTNKLTITCASEHLGYVKNCNMDVCQWGRAWVTDDSRQWVVKINPNSAPVIKGDYFAEHNTDLQLLAGYTTIDGSLEIFSYSWLHKSDSVTSLICLDELRSINGSLHINENNWLKDLSGLENLASIGGDLHIWDNDVMTDISALDGITSCRDLVISDNGALTTLSGFEDLATVSGDFNISYNSLLCTSMAVQLQNQVLSRGGIGGELTITGNKDCTAP